MIKQEYNQQLANIRAGVDSGHLSDSFGSAAVQQLTDKWESESSAIDQLARIERILVADGVQASRAYGHGNDAAGPEIRALWDAYQIVNGIRTTWIESI